VTSAVGVTLATLLFAAMLAGLAWSLSRRKGWARGPAIVLEMLLIPIGWYMLTGGLPLLGLPTILAGLVGAGGLLAPSTRAALGLRWPGSPGH
jgi:hypothetical protein